MPNQPRKNPTLAYSPEFLTTQTKEFTENYILRELADGPVLTFGCSGVTDKALQRLRKAGKLKYVKVKDGGHGWQLV